jgi:hypothetical protein
VNDAKEPLTAEEIVLSVWKMKKKMLDSGQTPRRLVISGLDFKKVQAYKERLGELPNPDMDYLQEESVFGIPVFIEECSPPRVE